MTPNEVESRDALTEMVEATTEICLFHHAERADAAVEALLALGVATSEIAVAGDGRTQLTGSARTATLQSMQIPEADIAALMEGLREGGTIVAVRTRPGLQEKVEGIFAEQSAALVDEVVIETNRGSMNVGT